MHTIDHKRRPALKAGELGLLLGLVAAAVAILAALLWGYYQIGRAAPGGGEFFSVWIGARELLTGPGDPYSVGGALGAQNLAYGRPALPGENPYWLDLPLFLLPLFLPLGAVTDPVLGRSIGMLLGQLALIAAMVISSHLLDRPAPRSQVILLGLFAGLNPYVLLALQEGMVTALLAAAYIGILWALQAGQDELAGALLALSLVKWEVGLPFLLLVVWRIFHDRRWRSLAGAGMTLSILLAVAFLLRPGWPLPFMTAVVAMVRSPHGTSMSAALLRLSPDYGSQVAWVLAAIVLVVLIYEWAVGREADFQRFAWTALLAIAATPLLGMRSDVANMAPLLACYTLIAAATQDRHRVGAWAGALLIGLAFFLPWMLVLRWGWPANGQARDLLFVLLPSLTTIGLYWTRWWFLRPARTWMDEVKAARG